MIATLAVLGGSSPFTAELVEAIVAEPAVRPRRLVLHGRDEAALRAMRSYAAHRLGSSCAVTATTELQRALTGATVVVHQIRYGGLRGRAEDAALARQAGVAADETLGPGGLAAAIRIFPAAFETGRAIVACSPAAWVVNLTNPLGPAVAALRAAGVERVVGVCELPEQTAALAIARAAVRGCDETWCYAGFNHRGFVYAAGWLGSLLAQIGDDGRFQGISAATIHRLDAIPVKHLALILEGAAGERPDRAARLAAIRLRLRRELAEQPGQRPAALAERRMPWYRHGVVPVLRALAQPGGRRVVATFAMADDIPRERPLWLDAGRATALAQQPPPAGVASLLRCLEDHERAVIAAATAPTGASVSTALQLDPLLRGRAPRRLGERLVQSAEGAAA